jgi:hypothetical protein
MGFLDHSTNNIIVDAVLTDKGRQLLARNDGSFNITRFAYGDDEVDYSIIKQFGRTVGKEKIEKNTPVFEAQTNSDLALKYRAISVANPFLTSLPNLAITVVNGATTLVRGSTPVSVDLQVKQTSLNNDVIDVDLRDASFLVQYDSRFLNVTGYENNVSTPSTGQNFISTVRIRQTSTNTDGSEGAIATFRTAIKPFSDDYYNYYATSTTSGVIITYINITGVASGDIITQQININKNSSI